MKRLLPIVFAIVTLHGRETQPPQLGFLQKLDQELMHGHQPQTQEIAVRCTYHVYPWVLSALRPNMSILNTILAQNNYSELMRNRATHRRIFEITQNAKTTLERIITAMKAPSAERTRFLSNPLSKQKYDEIISIAQYLIDNLNPDPNTNMVNLRALDDHINREQPKLKTYVQQIKTAAFQSQRGTINVQRNVGKQAIDVRPRCNAILGTEYYPWIIQDETQFKLVK